MLHSLLVAFSRPITKDYVLWNPNVKGSNFDDSEVDEPDEVDDSEVMEEED